MKIVIGIVVAFTLYGCARESTSDRHVQTVSGSRPASQPSRTQADMQLLDHWAQSPPASYGGERTGLRLLPLSTEVVDALKSARKSESATQPWQLPEHFGFLLEYGLRLHLTALTETCLSRSVDPKDSLAVAELIRLARIEPFVTAHEGGWLNNQFDAEFAWRGYSTYQFYVWAKELRIGLQEFPNLERLWKLLEAIDATGIQGVGGANVCHYGCGGVSLAEHRNASSSK